MIDHAETMAKMACLQRRTGNGPVLLGGMTKQANPLAGIHPALLGGVGGAALLGGTDYLMNGDRKKAMNSALIGGGLGALGGWGYQNLAERGGGNAIEGAKSVFADATDPTRAKVDVDLGGGKAGTVAAGGDAGIDKPDTSGNYAPATPEGQFAGKVGDRVWNTGAAALGGSPAGAGLNTAAYLTNFRVFNQTGTGTNKLNAPFSQTRTPWVGRSAGFAANLAAGVNNWGGQDGAAAKAWQMLRSTPTGNQRTLSHPFDGEPAK